MNKDYQVSHDHRSFRTQFKQLRTEAWKSQDFNGVWTRDLAIPVRRSNQLSYEATDVGSWSFVSSKEPVKNRCEVIYEMFHISHEMFHKMKCFILLDFKIRCSIYETFHISLHNKDYVIYISNPYFTGVDEPILWYELQNWVTQLWEKGARSSKKASFSINMEQSYHSY